MPRATTSNLGNQGGLVRNPNGGLGGQLQGIESFGKGLYNIGKGFISSPLFSGNSALSQPLSQIGQGFAALGLSGPQTDPQTATKTNPSAQKSNLLPIVKIPQTGTSSPQSSGSVNTYGLTPSSANWNQLQPGESISNWYQRVQGQNPNQTTVSKMGTSAGTGTPPSAPSSLGAFPGYVGALEKTAAVTTPQYTEAQNTYNQAIAQLRGLQAAQATAQKDIASEANPLSVSEGLSGITGQYYAGQEQAAAQQAAAAQAAAQAATGQQQAQQSGLAAAAQLGQPYAASVLGQYAPLTGEVQPYTSAGGTAGSGIGAGAQMEGNYSLAQNYYSGMVPAYNQAQSILNGDPTTGTQGLNGFLKANPDINPSTLNAANFVNQWTNNQFSSPKYQELGQYLTELLTTLTPIVGAQGVSNYKQQLVQSMVNPTSSTPSLQQQIQNMMNIANGKMNATYQTFTNPTATGIQNAGTQTNGTQPSSTGSSDINSWNFSING